MGFLGELFDDVLDLPGKIVEGSGKLLAETLCLPIKAVDAALEAGCRTKEEIQAFAEKWTE